MLPLFFIMYNSIAWFLFRRSLYVHFTPTSNPCMPPVNCTGLQYSPCQFLVRIRTRVGHYIVTRCFVATHISVSLHFIATLICPMLLPGKYRSLSNLTLINKNTTLKMICIWNDRVRYFFRHSESVTPQVGSICFLFTISNSGVYYTWAVFTFLLYWMRTLAYIAQWERPLVRWSPTQ